MFNNWLSEKEEEEEGEFLFVVFADIFGIGLSPQPIWLPMWHHLIKSWDKMLTISSCMSFHVAGDVSLQNNMTLSLLEFHQLLLSFRV